MEIQLIDGYVANVRPLKLFELDLVQKPDTRPFTYMMTFVTGETQEVIHDITGYASPPQRPDMPEADMTKGSAEWHELRAWQLYHSALSHQEMIIEDVAKYAEDVFDYILITAVDEYEEAVKHIDSDEDIERIFYMALVEPITIDMIGDTLRNTYNASYDDKDILDALSEVGGGQGVYNAIRVWENKLMIEMNMSEADYVLIPVVERCRKICAMMIDKWLEYLESHNAAKRGG